MEQKGRERKGDKHSPVLGRKGSVTRLRGGGCVVREIRGRVTRVIKGVTKGEYI